MLELVAQRSHLITFQLPPTLERNPNRHMIEQYKRALFWQGSTALNLKTELRKVRQTFWCLLLLILLLLCLFLVVMVLVTITLFLFLFCLPGGSLLAALM